MNSMKSPQEIPKSISLRVASLYLSSLRLSSLGQIDEGRKKLEEALEILSNMDTQSLRDAELAVKVSILLFRLLVASRLDQQAISSLKCLLERASEFGRRVLLFCLALLLEPYEPIRSFRLMEDSRSEFKKGFGLDPENLVEVPHQLYSSPYQLRR